LLSISCLCLSHELRCLNITFGWTQRRVVRIMWRNAVEFKLTRIMGARSSKEWTAGVYFTDFVSDGFIFFFMEMKLPLSMISLTISLEYIYCWVSDVGWVCECVFCMWWCCRLCFRGVSLYGEQMFGYISSLCWAQFVI